MKGKKRIWMFVTLLVIVSLLLGSFSCTPAAPKEDTIKIGGMYELTGFLSVLGTQESAAVQLALEQVNYEVAGKKIEYFEEDTGSDAVITMDKVRKLVETNGVQLIIGPTFGPSAQAMAPYLQRMQVPNLAISAHAYELPAYRSVWLITGLLGGQTYPMGLYAYEELGYRTMSAISQDWSAAEQYMGGCLKGFQDSGGEIVQHQRFPIGTIDYTPYIANLKSADVLASTIIGTDIVPSFSQFYDQGVWKKMPIICSSEVGLFEPPLLMELGDAAVGIVSESHYNWLAPTVGNKEFVAAYKAKTGVLPGGYAGMAYASTQVALDAIERTGGDMSYEALANALDETDLDTVRGHVKFTEQRVGITEARISKVASRSGDDFDIQLLARYIVTPELVGGSDWQFHVERVE